MVSPQASGRLPFVNYSGHNKVDIVARYQVFKHINAGSYVRHTLHSDQYAWVEKNCYVDLIIEVLHAQGLEPLAMLPFTLAVDFAGDQWTFYKPQHSELRELYGVDIQELGVWRPLLDHAVEHLGSGRLISIETDAFWLPDTFGTDYQKQHVKTTIALADLDPTEQRLGYFHNAGYFELAGEDFRHVFHMGTKQRDDVLPLFAELIHLDRLIKHCPADLAARSRLLLNKYLALRPTDNPVRRFAKRFVHELPLLQSSGLAHYHAWAFNNTRQLGSAFELAAANLNWLGQAGFKEFMEAASHFNEISVLNKGLILKIARAVNSGRPLDLSETFEKMSCAWESGMASLDLATGKTIN